MACVRPTIPKSCWSPALRLFVELSRELGVVKPAELGRQLSLLYDGVSVRASLDHDPKAAADARDIAETLLDASNARKRRR